MGSRLQAVARTISAPVTYPQRVLGWIVFTASNIIQEYIIMIRTAVLLATVTYVSCMDFGASGVWDSPMATDYWVKRFGFMWAGGRSGMHGFEGLQKTADLTYTNEIPTSVYNPSGMYGLKVMGVSSNIILTSDCQPNLKTTFFGHHSSQFTIQD